MKIILVKKGLVDDAIKNNEYWSLGPLNPIKNTLIKIVDFDLDEGETLITNVTVEEVAELPRKVTLKATKKQDDYSLYEVILSDFHYEIEKYSDNSVTIYMDEYPMKSEDIRDVFTKHFNNCNCNISIQ